MAARQRGAKAILVVTGPRSPNAGELIPMSFDTALSGSGIVAASMTGAVASMLLDGTGKALADVQRSLDSGNPHVAGFEIPGKVVAVKTSVVREKRTGHNIVGYLPASGPTDGVAKPWIALGAHYDHLGHGENGSSLADKTDAGRVHAGRRRQRVRQRRRAGGRRDSRRATAAPQRHAAVLVRGGDWA